MILKMKPDFHSFKPLPIKRKGNAGLYFLQRADEIVPTPEILESIFETCNEPHIYNWLFKESKPQGYQRKDAADFLKWGAEGWKKNAYFLFLMVSDKEEIVGAIDIKGNEIEAGEIGYWISQRHRGLGTSAVEALKIAAKDAGFKQLYAQVKSGNASSTTILKRNGFEENSYYLDPEDSCDFAYLCKL